MIPNLREVKVDTLWVWWFILLAVHRRQYSSILSMATLT